MNLRCILPVLFTFLAALFCEQPTVRAEPVTVKINGNPEDGWTLLVDGEPFTVRGAGGYTLLPELKEAGANAVRVWNTADADWFSVTEFLDEAHSLGLKVMLGLEMKTVRHMDYTDPKAVAVQKEELLDLVAMRKDHPALLLWGIGNEIEIGLGQDNPAAVWQAINDLAAEVKKIDPLHPTVVVLAGHDDWKLNAVEQHCPDIDIFGVNTYAPLPALPGKLKERNYPKPYLVTEYGYRGWWEAPRTEWGAIIEESSYTKADYFRRGWEKGIQDQPHCLGSFAFIWGDKEESTFTYFGTHTDKGEPTHAAAVLSELWTGKKVDMPAPPLLAVASDAAEEEIAPGTPIVARAQFETEPQEDWIYHWSIATDRSMKTKSGLTFENKSAEVLKGWVNRVPEKRIIAPETPDSYRLYLKVTNAEGKAATATFPFLVAEE